MKDERLVKTVMLGMVERYLIDLAEDGPITLTACAAEHWQRQSTSK